MKPWTIKPVAAAIVGLVMALVGVGLTFCWDKIFESILSSELPLSPSSRAYDIWKNSSDIPMHINFYFFNWTNPEELSVPGVKPKLQQVGPYSFKEVREKVNITFHPENYTVSYRQRKFWYFDASRSNGTINDTILQLNVVSVSAAAAVKHAPQFKIDAVDYLTSKFSPLYMKKKVRELLFEGYEDRLITMGRITGAEDLPPFDKFGWFYSRNGSSEFDGVLTVGTGEDILENLGEVKKWNYRDTSKFYKSPCNLVEGSAGEFWPPNRTKEDITIFTADLCRPLVYEYQRAEVYQGIEGYRFSLGEKTLGNSTKKRYPHEQARYFESTTTTEDFFIADPSTSESSRFEDPDIVDMGKCYCHGDCTPMGLMNITACRYGAPAFVSLPHFFKADPVLVDQVEGLSPNEKDHDFYVTLEPTTGIPLEVAARLQINILLRPSTGVKIFRDAPQIYFPMFWFELRVGAPPNLAWGLRQLLSLPTVGFYASIVLAIIGASIFVIVVLVQTLSLDLITPRGPKRRIAAASNQKSELVYMDTTVGSDEHERNDRQLMPYKS